MTSTRNIDDAHPGRISPSPDRDPVAEQPLTPELRAWLRPVLGEVSLVRSLVGGTTGQMLQLRRSGGDDVVVRRWSGLEAEHPGRVRREVAGLTALADAGLPLPALLAADPHGDVAGLPTTVTTFLPGRVELAPPDLDTWVQRLATMLARIHSEPVPDLLPCELWSSSEPSTWLEAEGDAGLAREARALTARPVDPTRRVLGHGDFQHFNVLWRDGDVSAVVDWPTVGVADRGLDVGHCRLNLAVLFSADAAMRFLDDYEALAGVTVDPAADVQRLLNFDATWPAGIPVQVAGRTVVDGPGMAGRVRETIRRTLRRAG